MAEFTTTINLSDLPAPNIIEALDFEDILSTIKTKLQTVVQELDVESLLESDPMSKLLEIMAYRELHIRQRINEAARGVMLATATGADLDNLAALLNIARQTNSDDPQADPLYKDDDGLRACIQSAFEGFSTAGPQGAYIFHALSASAKIKDVSVFSDSPGVVQVKILSVEGDGAADQSLLDTVQEALNNNEVRPITDQVRVGPAIIIAYTVDARLILYAGVGAQEVLDSAQRALQAYISGLHVFGADVTVAGLFSALFQPGVQNVDYVHLILHSVQDYTFNSQDTLTLNHSDIFNMDVQPEGGGTPFEDGIDYSVSVVADTGVVTRLHTGGIDAQATVSIRYDVLISDMLVDKASAAYGTVGLIDYSEYPSHPPIHLAKAIGFTDEDGNVDEIQGDVTITVASNEIDIGHYVLYWGENDTQKLPCGARINTFIDGSLMLDHQNIQEGIVIRDLDAKTTYTKGTDYELDSKTGVVTAINSLLDNVEVNVTYQLQPITSWAKEGKEEENAGSLVYAFPAHTPIPTDATHLLVFTKNAFGEMVTGISVEILDLDQ